MLVTEMSTEMYLSDFPSTLFEFYDKLSTNLLPPKHKARGLCEPKPLH